ncbi:MAG: hypothetical protein JSR85_01880 [Proteobacteria bacterium]|nr:hypothetical protein [Pseudomonadota bacterium]
MKLRHFLLSSIVLSSFAFSSAAYCMEAERPSKLMIRPYLPQDSSEEYIQNASKVFDTIMDAPQVDILHDDRASVNQQILPNTDTKDYGWSFRPHPNSLRELLEVCSQPHLKRAIDVGPGEGNETVAMLLTKRVHVTTFEKQSLQSKRLTQNVQTLTSKADAHFPLDIRFLSKAADFLTAEFKETFKGGYEIINANKVVHFFDPSQTSTFVKKVAFLLKPGGHLFITAVTPTPGSKFEKFICFEKKNTFPDGYVFYRQENELNEDWSGIVGAPQTVEVRTPKKEQSAHFRQTVRQTPRKAFAVTERVMHYHTEKTLGEALGNKFKIIKTFVITPKETGGDDKYQEHMISIVAERTEIN